MLKEAFRDLEEKLLDAVRSFYGDRLVSLVLYGSVARGTQRFDSDVDLLVVARPLPDGRMRRIREFDAAEERTRQNGLFRVRNHFGTMMCTVTYTVEGP